MIPATVLARSSEPFSGGSWTRLPCASSKANSPRAIASLWTSARMG